jgi:hypothetical protein
MSGPWREPEVEATIRRRQAARARVMGLLLGALVLLIFFVTIAKIKVLHHS